MSMSMEYVDHYPELAHLFVKKPWLVWWLTDKGGLSLEAATEAVLLHGDWCDVQLLCTTLGMERVQDIFLGLIARERHSFPPSFVHFFTHYFAVHGSPSRHIDAGTTAVAS